MSNKINVIPHGIILGYDKKVVNVDMPIWYDKEQMIIFLRKKNYCKEIAEELAELWVNDLNGSFRKGFEQGYLYAKEQPIDAVVNITNP